MRSSAHPVIISEDDYAAGAILSSGPDKNSALSVQRTRVNVANPDVALSFGYRPGYIGRIHLIASAASSGFSQSVKHIASPPRQQAETSFRVANELYMWPVI